jgi:surface polysaccharide O-acyltransferase-like enzyme
MSGLVTGFIKNCIIWEPVHFVFLCFFLSVTEAYAMPLFFMIAGYFIPASLTKKGIKKFASGRMFRLGIPTLMFVFLLFPFCLNIAIPSLNLAKHYFNAIVSFEFLSWAGPLWFALVLLIFTLTYLIIKKWFDPFVAKYAFGVTIVIALIGIFKKKFNTQNSLQKFLSNNSFAVYVFHPPILVAISVLLKNLDLPAVLKFSVVVCTAVPAAFIFVHLIRKIPLCRKIFS